MASSGRGAGAWDAGAWDKQPGNTGACILVVGIHSFRDSRQDEYSGGSTTQLDILRFTSSVIPRRISPRK